MVQNLTCAIIRNSIALTTTLSQYTIIGTQINTRLLFHFQTFFYLEYRFGPQIIMHFRVCSLVISLDYSKLTNSLHKGLIMCVFFSLVQACWHGFGKAVRLVRQRLFILMYVCFPLLILRSEMFPSQRKYTNSLVSATFGSGKKSC